MICGIIVLFIVDPDIFSARGRGGGGCLQALFWGSLFSNLGGEEAAGAVVAAGAAEDLAVVALVAAGAVLAEVLAAVEVLAVAAREAVGNRRLGHRWTRINTNQDQMSAIMF